MLQALAIERAAATRTAERMLHYHIAQYHNRCWLEWECSARPASTRPRARHKGGSLHAGEDVTRTVCITADGVLLGFLIDSKTISEARSVIYRPQPAERFRVPSDYAPLLAPEGAPVP
jgi:hypothetical protein